jgi:proline iminopeptidase
MSLKRAVRSILVPLYRCAVVACGISPALTAQASAPPHSAATVQEGYFPGADGVRIHYRITGPGTDTVVLVHGGPGTGMREGYEFDSLTEQGHAVLLYDQRGAGNSELVSTAARLTLASHVADLEALRRHFRLRKLSLIGLTWGSAIALHYGIAYPGTLARVVFLSPLPATGRHFVQRFAALDSLRPGEIKARLRAIDSLWPIAADSDLPGLCRQGLRASASEYQESESEARGDVCDYPAAVLRHRRLARIAALTAMGAEYDFSTALQRLAVPALVIDGERSRIPLEATRFWARHAGRSRLLLIPGAGHRTWIDRPATLLSAIHTFFRGEWPSGSVAIQPE